MSKAAPFVVLVALLIGVLGGFLWWGISSNRLKTELHDMRASTDRLSQQLDELRSGNQRLATELSVQKTRLETTQRDLRLEREMNGRLHLLVSGGKK